MIITFNEANGAQGHYMRCIFSFGTFLPNKVNSGLVLATVGEGNDLSDVFRFVSWLHTLKGNG